MGATTRRPSPLSIGLTLALLVACGCESGASPNAGQGQQAPGDQGQQGPAPTVQAAAVQKLGKALTGADEVKVADLLRDPKGYEGKTVRVSGKVHDFCHHRRAWFAVTAVSGEGMVRVFTLPHFKVPADCKGKAAVAEGRVEVITISPEQVEHFGKEHKFLKGVEVKEGEPLHRPVIRAAGAEFGS